MDLNLIDEASRLLHPGDTTWRDLIAITTVDISAVDASSSQLDGPPWVWWGLLALAPLTPLGIKFICGLMNRGRFQERGEWTTLSKTT